jgi:hypothetical protein
MSIFRRPIPGLTAKATRSGSAGVARVFSLLACFFFIGAVSVPAGATPALIAGDQVSLIGIEGDSPNPNPGAAFPAALTVGPAGSNGLFPVSQLTVLNEAGTCLSCLWQALDLSNLFIGQGATDLELSGFITATLPSGVNFQVSLSASTESWAYQRQIPGSPVITGIVDAPAVVPEPTSLALLSTALVGLGIGLLRRRRNRSGRLQAHEI